MATTSKDALSLLNCLEAIDIILSNVRYNKKLTKNCADFIAETTTTTKQFVKEKNEKIKKCKDTNLQVSLVPFITFVTRHTYDLLQFQIVAKCKLVIVQQQYIKKCQRKRNQLLFDGRFVQESTLPQNSNSSSHSHINRLRCLLLDPNGNLVKIDNNTHFLPKLSKYNYREVEKIQSLWQLLDLPNSLSETANAASAAEQQKQH